MRFKMLKSTIFALIVLLGFVFISIPTYANSDNSSTAQVIAKSSNNTKNLKKQLDKANNKINSLQKQLNKAKSEQKKNTTTNSVTVPQASSKTNSDMCNDPLVPDSIKTASGCDGSTEDPLPPTIVNILNAIIAISGLISAIFVVVGGINYMTSTGDANKIKKARDTILYALIGLVICALAFAIVNFVITNLLNGNSESNAFIPSKSGTTQLANHYPHHPVKEAKHV